MLVVDCGTVRYEEALRWQHLLVAARIEDAIDDVLLMCEHDRVYTAGRHADVDAHVLGTTDIRVVRIDRGGDVTYHGPGQVVAYPIVRLRGPLRVRAYVEALGEACVRTAASFGVNARAERARPGVWVGEDKLAAIGVRIQRSVTSHGLALNVATDLRDFDGIVPCGLRDAGVCSLRSLGVDASVEEVRRRMVAQLGTTLDRPVESATIADLGLVPALV